MIFVGIDDTDILGARGTNQLAKEIVRRAAEHWSCQWIVRHQLLDDPRIPYTSQNGSASMVFEARNGSTLEQLTDLCRATMRDWFILGSDPGLCVASSVPDAVKSFGQRCQQQVVTQDDARQLAAESGLYLDGLGGTSGGVIGSLAAVGLAAIGSDGRIVQWQSWPDDLAGPQPISELTRRGISVQVDGTGELIHDGTVNVGKHLRPNLRGGRATLFVVPDHSTPSTADYFALKLK